MGELKLKRKRDLQNGNFEYTYQCFCDPKPLKEIITVGGNDVEAQMNAQQECDEYCSQRTAEDSVDKELTKVTNSQHPIQSVETLITKVLTQSEISSFQSASSKNLLDAWDYVEEIDVEGAHAHAGGRTTVTKRYQLPDATRKFEWDQEIVKKDNDSGWEFHANSPQDIVWVVWAQNCVFSCDEIILRVKYRIVPI